MVEYVQDMLALVQKGDRQGYIFFGALYFALVCTYSLIFQLRMYFWSSTEGKLIKSEVASRGGASWQSGTRYSGDVEYEYEVNGKKYVGSKLSSLSMVTSHNAQFALRALMKHIKKTPNGNIIVYYNPKKPKKCILVRPGIKTQTFTIIVGYALMCAYIVEFVY